MKHLLPVLLAMLAMAPAVAAEDEPAAEDAGSVLVTTIVPAKGELQQSVTAYGVAQPAPDKSMAVASLHAAQVLRLRVVAGQVVTKGEALLDLGADPAASLAYAQAASDVELAQGELARTRKMLEQRLATNSQVAQAEKAVKDAEATLAARKREGGASAVETMAAPIAGVVTSVAVSNGDHVQPGATLLDLSIADAGAALVGVSAEERGRINAGQAVRLIDLDSSGATVTGVVASVGGAADPKTGLFTVVLKTGDGQTPLPPSAHVRATIEARAVSGWIFPRDAVLIDGDGPALFQVANGKAVRVPIQVVAAAGDKLAVSGAVDPARKLVTAGAYQLADGAAVREQGAQAEPEDKPAK
jgi:RND family efflux transporter MFP subunit